MVFACRLLVCIFSFCQLIFLLVTDVNYALANLHSYAKDANIIGQMPNEQNSLVEEENDVLLEDDLVDEDDDW